MTPEEEERILRNPKLRDYYGLKLKVPTDAAVEHLRMLNSEPYYMSYRHIAELAGISKSTITELVRGSRKGQRVRNVHRDIEAAILGVRPVLGAPPEGFKGGRVPALEARRRVRALCALGFPYRFIGEALGYSTYQHANAFAVGNVGREYVHHSFHLKVAEVYDKYADTDPLSFGVPQRSVTLSRRLASEASWAPPSCWDDDTIGDPDAFPEWTGKCGSPYGYYLHREHGIFLTKGGSVRCVPCREAKAEASEMYRTRQAEIRRLYAEEWTVAQIAEEVGVTERTVQRAVKHVAN